MIVRRRLIPAGWHTLWRRFIRDERAAYSLEFALLAPLFFGLIAAFVEYDYLNYENDALQLAVSQAARAVLTGSAQAQTDLTQTGDGLATTAKDFATNYICNQSVMKNTVMGAAGASTCASKLIIDVRCASTYAEAGNETTTAFYKGPYQYNLGLPSTVVVMRVIYPLPAILPISFATTTSPTRVGLVNDAPTAVGVWSHLLLATEVFETEPYSTQNYNPASVSAVCP